MSNQETGKVESKGFSPGVFVVALVVFITLKSCHNNIPFIGSLGDPFAGHVYSMGYILTLEFKLDHTLLVDGEGPYEYKVLDTSQGKVAEWKVVSTGYKRLGNSDRMIKDFVFNKFRARLMSDKKSVEWQRFADENTIVETLTLEKQ